MDNGRHLAGLIEVMMCDPFHRLMRKFTGYHCDLIGLYYRQKLGDITSQCHVLLYDTYTGSAVSKTATDMSSLKSDPSCVSISLRDLMGLRREEGGNGEDIRNSGNDPNHEEEFRNIILRMMTHRTSSDITRETSDIKRCLRYTMLRLSGVISNRTPVNGYSIVNQAFLAMAGLDYSARKSDLCDDLLDLGLLDSPVIYDVRTMDSQVQHSSIHLPYLRNLDLLYEVCKDLTISQSTFFDRICSTLGSSATCHYSTSPYVTPSPKSPTTVSNIPPMPYSVSMAINDDSVDSYHEWRIPTPHTDVERSCSIHDLPVITGNVMTPVQLPTSIPVVTVQPSRMSLLSSPVNHGQNQNQNHNHNHSQNDINTIKAIFDAELSLITAIDELDGRALSEARLNLNRLRSQYNIQLLPDLQLADILASIEKTVVSLKQRIDTAIRDVKSSRPPTFDLSCMTDEINEICDLHGVPPITDRNDIREGSYSAVALIGKDGLRKPPPITITTDNGTTIVLPSMGCNLSQCDVSTLEFVLRHLDGHDYREKRFTSLRIQVARELALRQKSLQET